MATLRVTTINKTPSVVVLKAEGPVTGECVQVLEKECRGWLNQGQSLELDFSGVTLIDSEGIAMLKHLPADQLQLKHCPNFIQHLLNLKGERETHDFCSERRAS